MKSMLQPGQGSDLKRIVIDLPFLNKATVKNKLLYGLALQFHAVKGNSKGNWPLQDLFVNLSGSCPLSHVVKHGISPITVKRLMRS